MLCLLVFVATADRTPTACAGDDRHEEFHVMSESENCVGTAAGRGSVGELSEDP